MFNPDTSLELPCSHYLSQDSSDSALRFRSSEYEIYTVGAVLDPNQKNPGLAQDRGNSNDVSGFNKYPFWRTIRSRNRRFCLIRAKLLISIVLGVITLLFETSCVRNFNSNSSEEISSIIPSENISVIPRHREDSSNPEILRTTLAPFEPHMPTPSRFFTADLSMPEKFSTTNNLAKKVGAFYHSFGEIIFVQGVVTDSFGIPIDGAIIEIWQTNAAGKYHSLLESNSQYVDKFFNMSGRTVTDNLGNYHFITIMPGSNPGRAPHINMNVYHTQFGKLETEMYFEDHPYNSEDYQYLSYKEDEQKLLTATVRHSDISNTKSNKLLTFNIVMRGVHQYKKYK